MPGTRTSTATAPLLARKTVNEFVEHLCATILQERGAAPDETVTLPKLVKLTAAALQLTPNDVPNTAKAAETIRRMMSNLTTVANGLAELRNAYGTGHGKSAATRGLGPRHARLAVGAASTLALFLFETHEERP